MDLSEPKQELRHDLKEAVALLRWAMTRVAQLSELDLRMTPTRS